LHLALLLQTLAPPALGLVASNTRTSGTCLLGRVCVVVHGCCCMSGLILSVRTSGTPGPGMTAGGATPGWARAGGGTPGSWRPGTPGPGGVYIFVRVCVCMCTCTMVRVCMCTCTMVRVCMCTCTYMDVYVYDGASIPCGVVCAYIFVCICVHVYIFVCMCVHVLMYMCSFSRPPKGRNGVLQPLRPQPPEGVYTSHAQELNATDTYVSVGFGSWACEVCTFGIGGQYRVTSPKTFEASSLEIIYASLSLSLSISLYVYIYISIYLSISLSLSLYAKRSSLWENTSGKRRHL
jgi:hypothetical protein